MKKEINEVPIMPGYTGLTLSRKPVPFTPDKIMDALGIEKENRPVWMITPMEIEQRNMIDSDNSQVRAKVALWAKENGLKLSDFNDMYVFDKKGELVCDEDGKPKLKDGRSIEDYVAYQAMIDYYGDTDLRSEIVRKNIVGIKSKNKELKFKKDDEGFFSIDEFKHYHPKLIEEFFDKINSISNPNQLLTLGL